MTYTIQGMTVDEFTSGYIECMLWAEEERLKEQADIDIDSDRLHIDSLTQCITECSDFVKSHKSLLDQFCKGLRRRGNEGPMGSAGHDFWLTRNGHGAGFWDRGLGKVGEALSEAARLEGGRDVYVGDDGLIHIQ